jgi:hypothetical protein
MKQNAVITAEKSKRKPFMQSGKRETFVQSPLLKRANSNRISNQEKGADNFAKIASQSPEIRNAFFINSLSTNTTQKPNKNPAEQRGDALNPKLADAFKNEFDHDFSDVQVHFDSTSTQLASDFNAAAFTVGNHIFLNQHVFKAKNPDSLYVLAHELFHTIGANPLTDALQIQLKPLTELNDRTVPQQTALQRAVDIGMGERGKVNSGTVNEDKTRVGWEYLVEYFKTTLGADTIIADKSEYKPGKFLEENIKYIKLGKAQKVKEVGGKYVVTTVDNVDLLPSWCGIFAFWALHKGGVHPPKWELGKSNFTAKDQFRKGEYLPRPGDIVIKNGYNHYALVVKTDPETVTDTKDLQNVKVTTINGNTAGSNHLGGQIQSKTDPYSYWDYYVNPFFKGVTLTDEKDYKVDERLKESLGISISSEPAAKDVDLTVGEYSATLNPVGGLNIPETEKEKKDKPEEVEEVKVDPKEIMAQDPEFAEINSSLKQNAKSKKEHDTPENKANEAQHSAVSPKNERLGKAKAVKIEKLDNLPAPKKFDGEELKASILKEVGLLLKEKEDEANRTGDKPKIKDNEIKEVKDKNNKEIQQKKSESVGDIVKTHDKEPDESSIEERKTGDVIVEDPGKNSKIQNTEKAVAKPIADERITLEEESGQIDARMAENDVDEQQLEESEEPQFTSSLNEKRGSQAEAAKVKDDYRAIENDKLSKDKKNAKNIVNSGVDKIHGVRDTEFSNVNSVKNATKTADELKRKEVTDGIEKIYSDSEKLVTEKLNALETSVNIEFDSIMTTANTHFKDNVNKGLDDEFTWEWAAKKLDREDYNKRVKKVFVRESEKYTTELSNALSPLTTRIANTLNAIVEEIQAAKNAVMVFVNGLEPSLTALGVESAKGVMEKFGNLENSVNEKQEALTSSLAKKYADGVMSLETQFKEIMDSRKSWLEKALDAIVDAIKEIINLLADLKKALERAAGYASRIIKSPRKFFNNLVDGATAGFNSFVKNIGKHLLEGALAWVTGEMSEAGIQLPKEFNFRGILSIIFQVLGITVENVKKIARTVIGDRYVNMLEKGVDLGMKVGDKIFTIFKIIKNEGIAGLWEFIKEQFSDLKERLLEEAKTFAIKTIIEVAVVKLVSMLIPGAGFISAIKSLIDFIMTLFAKARQIVNIITGIIDTFGEILAGNVSKVSTMIENVLAKFLALAISFLAAILGLGNIGKKMNEIIQKKIKDPINKAITKMMEKLKGVMTKLGIFKLMDKIDEKIKQGKNWVEEKKEAVKDKAAKTWDKFKKWLSLKKQFKTKSGETHSLYFDKTKKSNLTIASKPISFNAFINSIKAIDKEQEKAKNLALQIAIKIDKKKEEAIKKKEPTDDEVKMFESQKADALKSLFEELALQAVILFETFASPDAKVNFGPQDSASQFATSMSALYLNKKYQTNGKPPTSKNTNVYQILNLRKSGSSTYYIKGHLLNQKMGGKGDWDNLTPLSRSGNSQHELNVESVGKTFLDSSAIISYEVAPVYNFGQRKNEGDSVLKKIKSSGDPEYDTKAKIIEAENYVPVSLKCSANLMNKSGDSFVKGPVVFDNKLVQNSIDRGEKDYDINGEKKIIVYLDSDKLEDNLKMANFEKVLIEKVINAKAKDANIKRYDKLFSLGNIVDSKEQNKIKDQILLYHLTA